MVKERPDLVDLVVDLPDDDDLTKKRDKNIRGAYARGFGFAWCAVAGCPLALYLRGDAGFESLWLVLAFAAVGVSVSTWGVWVSR